MRQLLKRIPAVAPGLYDRLKWLETPVRYSFGAGSGPLTFYLPAWGALEPTREGTFRPGEYAKVAGGRLMCGEGDDCIHVMSRR